MTLLELMLESMMIIDIPDWGLCPWWHFKWSAYALRKLSLKFGQNVLSLKASRSPSKINDIAAVFAGVSNDFEHSFLRAHADHPKSCLVHPPHSGMSIILIDSSKNCSNVIDLWGWSWCLQTQQISTKFYTGLPQSICRPSKMTSRTPALVRNIHNHHQLQQKLQQCH